MQIDIETVAQLHAFARGEMTWAEVEGMTAEEAREIARVGCELSAAGRYEEARILFEGLVEGNPKDAASRAALGTVYQNLGRAEEALEEYSEALELDPDQPVALVNRGELYLKEGNPQGLTDVARAVEADPEGETSAGRRARALVQAMALVAHERLKAAPALPV
jgi:Flp pilus assembly protein TadD